MSGASRWGKAAVLSLLAVYLWIAIGALGIVMPRSGADPSWRSVLVEGWIAGWRWGVDIIDNFGPYGFLYSQEYHPDAAGLILGLNAGLAATLVAAWLFLMRGLRLWAQIVLSAGFLLAMTGRRETFFFAFPVFLTLLHIRDDRDSALSIRVLLVMAIALSAEVKWTFFVVAAPVLALLDLDSIFHRRWPWHLLLGTVTAMLLHALAGQDFADLPALIALTSDQTAGFADALGKGGRVWELALFVTLNVVAVLVIFLCLPGSLLRRGIVWLALCGVLFVSFKAGYVRQDPAHTHSSWNFLGLCLLACGAASGYRVRWPIVLLAVTMGAGALGLGTYFQNRPDFFDFNFRFRPLADSSKLAAIVDWKGWKSGQDKIRERSRASIRNAFQLPKLEGTVDALPPLQAEILAWSLDYRPHPTMQEHQAYTPATLAADGAFFSSDRAPDYLIFSPAASEDRYPSLIEGAVWPILLSRYEPAIRLEKHLILKRRETPANPLVFGVEGEGRGVWDEWIWLFKTEIAGAFLRVNAGATPLGKGVSFFYRPPVVWIEVRLASGKILRHRLPLGLAAAGFFLSPYVASLDAYQTLASGRLGEMGEERVVAFRLRYEADRAAELQPEFSFFITPIAVSEAHPSAGSPVTGRSAHE